MFQKIIIILLQLLHIKGIEPTLTVRKNEVKFGSISMDDVSYRSCWSLLIFNSHGCWAYLLHNVY